jgi:hypothetical protein
MEHIRQSSQEHTSGPFDVAKDVPGLTPTTYPGAVLNLPISNSIEKLRSVGRGVNSGNLKEDHSEPSGIGSTGRCPAPGQALPLYMDQASLHHDTRPELAENSYHFRVTIYRKAVGTQPSLYQRFKELNQLRLRIFGYAVLTSHNHVGLCIHQGDKTAGALKECTIQDKVPALPQVRYGFRRLLFHIVVDHTVKLPWTVPALVCQLSDRVTFDNPEPEPLLSGASDGLITPATGVSARATVPTLFPFSITPVSPKNSRTSFTAFFYS